MKRVFLISLLSFGHWFMAFSQTANEKDSVNDSHILNEVIIKAPETPYKLLKGGVITKIAGTPLSNVGTCFDVLSQMPGVRVDEDAIEIIGKGTPVIYINGRRLTHRNYNVCLPKTFRMLVLSPIPVRNMVRR